LPQKAIRHSREHKRPGIPALGHEPHRAEEVKDGTSLVHQIIAAPLDPQFSTCFHLSDS